HPAYHPRINIKLLMLAHVDSMRSSRRIAKNANENVVYIYLAEKTQPDFRTISEFRRKNKKLISNVFKELNTFALKEGLLDLSHLMIDGTKIKADANNNRVIEKETLDKLSKYIDRVIEEGISIDEEEDKLYGDRGLHQLPEELNDSEKRRPIIRQIVNNINKSMKEGNKENVQQIKSDLQNLKQKMEGQGIKRYSFTDLESRFMQSYKKHTDLCYNAQIIVDKNGLIVSNDVVNETADRSQSIPMINKVEQNFGQLPKGTKFIGDAGYENGEALEELEQRGLDLFVAGKNMINKPKKKFAKANFAYDEENDRYICPKGKMLNFVSITTTHNRYDYMKNYRCKNCSTCPYQKECCKNYKSRSIGATPFDKLLNRIKVKLKTPEGRATYNLRKQTVERSFGDMKYHKKFTNFLLRGKEKAKIEWNLSCIAHNLVMINNLMKKRNLAGC
ncbi:MAG: IS1182 family transposase, partial [Thermodesulfobacteriota bacterium]